MLSLRRSEVPEYLRNSGFYLSLNAEDDEELSLPIDNVKLDDSVTDEASLRHLLSTLRFWAANTVPDGLYDWATTPSNELYASVMSEFEVDLSYVLPLRTLRTSRPHDRLIIAARSGSVELVKYLLSHGYRCSARVTEAAAAAGHLPCLQYLHSIGCVWDATTCISAVKNGHFECLKYAHLHGCAWTACYMTHYAALRGSLPCLQYAVEHDCPLAGSMYIKAANIDAVDCVKYLHNQYVPFPSGFLLHVVSENSLKCVEFALQRNCRITDDLLTRVRSVECMQLLHDTGYEWTVDSAALATRAGILVLKFLHEHGCPWDESTLTSALTSHKVTASNEPDITCLVYAMENGCPAPFELMMWAIQEGNLPAVKYLLTCGWECDATDIAVAAKNGHIGVLMYLHSQSVPWDERTTTAAANHNRVKCLKYAISNNCPANADIGRYPAILGYAATVRYLASMGFKEYELPYMSPVD